MTVCVCACSVAQACLPLGDPLDCSSPGLCPWNFSDKNPGTSCHFLFQGIFPTQGSNCVPCSTCSWLEDSLGCLKLEVTQLCPTLCDPTDYSSWSSPVQNTGVGNLFLLQGIFPTQGSNPGLPHCRWIPYELSHQGSPKILEWVAYPFSRESSQPKNQTGVSCIAGRFFTS